MKRLINSFILLFFVATVSAQVDTLYISLSKGKVAKYAVDQIYSMGFTAVEAPEFPVADNSTAFDKLKPTASVKMLLEKVGAACTDTLGRINITEDEYNEIKAFVDKEVAGLTKQYDIYKKCYNWITGNVKYAQGYVNNDPYQVFINKTAICQGYANLLHVMMRTQGVPAMVVNGYMQSQIYNGMLTGMGHAWNYVCCDGVWYVSDPTNGFEYKMSNLNDYETWLAPTSMDVVLFKEDDCWLNFNECFLNICKVTSEDNVFVTPYSVQGFKVTCFNPEDTVPSNIRELYIGENIASLGENIINLKERAPSVEYVTVDPDNTCFTSHAGVVYYSNGYKPSDVYKQIDKNIPAYIPTALKRLELKAIDNYLLGLVYDKNSIYNHENIEEIVFPRETTSIESYAVENCPNLKVAHVPIGATVKTGAFARVHSTFKIVYYAK